MARYKRGEVAITVLLGLQVCSLSFAEPVAAVGIGFGFWFTLAIAVVTIWAVTTASPSPRLATIALLALIPAAVAVALRRWASMPTTDGLAACAALAAVLVMSWIVAKRVYGPGVAASMRVRGAFVLYFNIAIGFGAVYQLLEELLPGSFRGLEPNETQQQVSADLFYFSVITLSSTGFGDIVPLHRIARGIASLEAVAGQLYIATVLGRLITLHGTDQPSNGSD